MDREDIRGPARASMQSIEEVVQEMDGYIRERMRLTPTQAAMMTPIVRRACHQIARRMELQPVIYGKELVLHIKKEGRRAEEWMNREFGPGLITRSGKYAAHPQSVMCRATFFALLDEWKAKNEGKSARKRLRKQIGITEKEKKDANNDHLERFEQSSAPNR